MVLRFENDGRCVCVSEGLTSVVLLWSYALNAMGVVCVCVSDGPCSVVLCCFGFESDGSGVSLGPTSVVLLWSFARIRMNSVVLL